MKCIVGHIGFQVRDARNRTIHQISKFCYFAENIVFDRCKFCFQILANFVYFILKLTLCVVDVVYSRLFQLQCFGFSQFYGISELFYFLLNGFYLIDKIVHGACKIR